MKKISKNLSFLLFSFSVVAVGLFNDFIAAAFSAVTAVILAVTVIRRKNLTLKLNLTSAFALSLPAFYAVSVLWAVDQGLALFGVFKFLPPALFLLLMTQRGEAPSDILRKIPYLAASVTVISAILMQIKPIADLFSVASRLSGTFQYSNTYAVFCLVSLIILLCDRSVSRWDIAVSLVLVFGILYSGSRSVFVLSGITLLVLIFRIKKNSAKIALISAIVISAGLFVLYALVFDKSYLLQRFTSISFTESTFVGRLLYWRDALPVIIRRPFGLGYMGYYFMQGSFKTGVYSVMFVHNDLLQIILDVGFIPFILFCIMVVRSLASKTLSFSVKLALCVFCAHAMFDFDLQFGAMLILFLLLTDTESGREYKLSCTGLISAFLSVILLCSSYFSVAAFLQFKGMHESAVSVYGLNTFSRIELLKTTSNVRKLKNDSEKIISQNKYVSLAYDALARSCFSQGNFEDVVKYKKLAIKYNYFDIDEYEDLCRMLISGIGLYGNSGDRVGVEYCKRELLSVERYISDAKGKISELGGMIRDQADFTLSSEVAEYMNMIKLEG